MTLLPQITTCKPPFFASAPTGLNDSRDVSQGLVMRSNQGVASQAPMQTSACPQGQFSQFRYVALRHVIGFAVDKVKPVVSEASLKLRGR